MGAASSEEVVVLSVQIWKMVVHWEVYLEGGPSPNSEVVMVLLKWRAMCKAS